MHLGMPNGPGIPNVCTYYELKDVGRLQIVVLHMDPKAHMGHSISFVCLQCLQSCPERILWHLVGWKTHFPLLLGGIIGLFAIGISCSASAVILRARKIQQIDFSPQ